jgi:predicted nucleic acid-binding Zn ribbon protein
MSAFDYVCPLCHNRLTVASSAALPTTCPACGLSITKQEFTQQRLAVEKLRRRGMTITLLSWVIGLLLIVVLIAALFRLGRPDAP